MGRAKLWLGLLLVASSALLCTACQQPDNSMDCCETCWPVGRIGPTYDCLCEEWVDPGCEPRTPCCPPSGAIGRGGIGP